MNLALATPPVTAPFSRLDWWKEEFYRLKNVRRLNSVGDRRESPAEHSWSSIILADYFITNFYETRISRLRVYDLLLYHDLVEIESGDTPLHPKADRSTQGRNEAKAASVLQEKLPRSLKNKYLKLFREFAEQETLEARFAKAIEQLDAIIQETDYRSDWKGWSEEFLRKNKQEYFKDFPEIDAFFENTVAYCRANGYFSQ